MGDYEGKQTKSGLIGRNEVGMGGIASVSLRNLPPASADVRGHPRSVWTENGRWGLLGHRGGESPYIKETRAGRPDYCFRQLPWAFADIRDVCGRQMEAVIFSGQGGGGPLNGTK